MIHNLNLQTPTLHFTFDNFFCSREQNPGAEKSKKQLKKEAKEAEKAQKKAERKAANVSAFDFAVLPCTHVKEVQTQI